jgi:hypothetical protein
MLREKNEELDLHPASESINKQKEKILIDINQYLEQLNRFD